MKSPFYKREALRPHIPQAQWRAVLAAGCVQGDGKLHLAPARLRSNLTRGMISARANSPIAIVDVMWDRAVTTRSQIRHPEPPMAIFCAPAFTDKAAALAAAARRDHSPRLPRAIRSTPRPEGRHTANRARQQHMPLQHLRPTNHRPQSRRQDLHHPLIPRLRPFRPILKTGTGLRSIRTAPCECWLGLSLQRSLRPDQRRSNCALAGRIASRLMTAAISLLRVLVVRQRPLTISRRTEALTAACIGRWKINGRQRSNRASLSMSRSSPNTQANRAVQTGSMFGSVSERSSLKKSFRI